MKQKMVYISGHNPEELYRKLNEDFLDKGWTLVNNQHPEVIPGRWGELVLLTLVEGDEQKVGGVENDGSEDVTAF